jgi:ABC-2 type transport system permease protein
VAEPARTAGIYARLYASRVRSQLQYRLSYLLQALATVATAFVDLLVILVLFSHFDRLRGWSLWEVAFLYGSSYLPFKLADMAVGKVERLGEHIRTGAFDAILVRPLGTLPQTVTADVDLKQAGGALQGAAVFAVALAHVHLAWTAGRAAVLAAMLASGFVIFCSAWVAMNATAFWLVDAREHANAFTYGGNFLTQLPLDLFSGWFRRLFAFVVPLAFVNYFPSLYLLGKPGQGWPGVLRFASPAVAAAAAAVAAAVWRAGVRRYNSTGS